MFTIIARYATIVLSAALVALTGYSLYLRSQTATLTATVAANTVVIQTQDREIKAGVEREKRNALVLKNYQTENAVLAKKKKESDDKLDKVLEANRDWADQPIPDGVSDWLRDN